MLRSLNAVYTRPSMRRRYEVWFLRLGLADGSGAWWFRYLLTNPGRSGCPTHPAGAPVQLWATWFPRGAMPQSFIQGFPLDALELSRRASSPFFLRIGRNRINEDSCAGRVEQDGRLVTWELRYRSTLAATMSNVGWIGFSRTPHSDAIFSGEIALDGQLFRGDALGFGLQGHNCGYRHRHLWTWAHAYLPAPSGASTFEALVYEIPFGLRFRKALLWDEGRLYTFPNLKELCRERDRMQWVLECAGDGAALRVEFDGGGPSLHRLPYLKTDCSGTFPVCNNSLAHAGFAFQRPGSPARQFSTDSGAVLEMVGG